MFCKNCGSEINSDSIFCENCGTRVKEEPVNNVSQNNTNNVEENKNANILCIISLICTFGLDIIATLISEFIPSKSTNLIVSILYLGPLAGIVLAIIARVKYPSSKFAKVLLIVYLVLFVGSIIFSIVFMFACAYAFRDCGRIG